MSYGNRFAWMTAVGAVILCAAATPARATDRDTLRDRLEFTYVSDADANPHVAAVILNNTNIMAGTESGAFWSNSNINNLKGLVRALLRDGAHGGDANLQHYLAKIVSVTDSKKVQVFLFDDSTAAISNRSRAEARWGGCVTSGGRFWPCASHLSGAIYDGAIWVGNHHMAGRAGRTTFIHEAVHTRDNTDGRAHYFRINGRNYRYGSDGDHYDVEVIPNMALTYSEGIANAIALMYNAADEQFYWNLFASDGLLWVETAEPPRTSGVSPSIWLNSSLRRAGIAAATIPAPLRTQLQASSYGRGLLSAYTPYRVSTLPAGVLIKNEFILAQIVASYMQHVPPDNFFTALRQTNRLLYRASGSGIAVLFEMLGNLGLPMGETVRSVTGSFPGPKKYLIPLAFADYYTRYHATNETQFKAIFENALPQSWIDLYLVGYQSQVRSSVPFPATGRPSRGALTEIAVALGVTSQEASVTRTEGSGTVQPASE